MGDVKDLKNTAAIKKLHELAKDKACLFCTYQNEYSIDARPMMTQDIDDEGTFWFFSKTESNKNVQIAKLAVVELLYSNPNDSYLFVKGKAEIQRDQFTIDKLWTPFAKTWFTEGKNDPSLTLLKVTPTDAYYWDTKHGKMISLLKIAISAATGTSMDDGIEGKLNP